MKNINRILVSMLFAISTAICTGCIKEEINVKADMSQYSGLIDEDHVFIESSVDNFLEKASKGETFVAYFGQPTCYWCNEVIQTLNDTAKEYSEIVLYIDMTTPSEDEYQSLVDSIEEYLDYGNDGKKHLYTPEVIFIKDGETSLIANCVSKEDEDGNLILDKENQKARYVEGFKSLYSAKAQ